MRWVRKLVMREEGVSTPRIRCTQREPFRGKFSYSHMFNLPISWFLISTLLLKQKQKRFFIWGA